MEDAAVVDVIQACREALILLFTNWLLLLLFSSNVQLRY